MKISAFFYAMHIQKEIEFILYVENQGASRDFYAALFQQVPSLDVPGMTEFTLAPNVKLGLMPNDGIAKILKDKTPHPEKGKHIPRCELYLNVDDLEQVYQHVLSLNILIISAPENRNWGDRVFYCSDLDGHVIAFAEKV